MNQIYLIGAILVAATFLIASTSNKTLAYTCSSSSSTHDVNSQSGVSGSSGSCSSSSSSTTSGPHGSAQFAACGSPGVARFGICLTDTSCSATASSQTASGVEGLKTSPRVSVIFNLFGSSGNVAGNAATSSGSPGGVQSTSSTSAGGSQSSCSSSSGNAATGSTSSTSTSQPGRCP